MKKGIGVLFVFLFLLVNLTLVSAVCDDDQTLFRLYRENNSHVSVYSDGNYPIEVCYNEFFEIDYMGSESHTCNADESNVIFWVNSSKNSHISADEKDEYTLPVCYGNLECKFTNSPCSVTEVLIAKASSLDNAHISLNQTDYDYNICCTNGLSLRESFWSDLNGAQIANTELGDTVLMIAKGFEFNNSQTHNYSISGVADLNLIEKGWNWITFRGWEPAESWVMNSINDWKTRVVGRFSFHVNVIGTNISSDSGYLIISGDAIDKIPFVEILSNETIVTVVNTSVDFSASVHDEDDFLTLTWDFADGSSPIVNQSYALATSNSLYVNATHNFTEPGHYVVRLTAEEKTRPEKAFDSVDVFVYGEGINVIPVVTSPINGKNDYGSTIWFDASQSFVANCSLTKFRSGYDITIKGTDLNCMYIHAPGQSTVGSGYNLNVQWVIDSQTDSRWNGEWGKSLPTGTVQKFLRYFPQAKEHTAEFSLNYVSL